MNTRAETNCKLSPLRVLGLNLLSGRLGWLEPQGIIFVQVLVGPNPARRLSKWDWFEFKYPVIRVEYLEPQFWVENGRFEEWSKAHTHKLSIGGHL